MIENSQCENPNWYNKRKFCGVWWPWGRPGVDRPARKQGFACSQMQGRMTVHAIVPQTKQVESKQLGIILDVVLCGSGLRDDDMSFKEGPSGSSACGSCAT
jgi:hypothetical protein